jgi:hypothetical protein
MVDRPNPPVSAIRPRLVLAVALLLMLLWGITRTQAAGVALALAGLISWVALGESFSNIKVAGAVMAGIGVAAAQFGAAPAARQKPQPTDAPV